MIRNITPSLSGRRANEILFDYEPPEKSGGSFNHNFWLKLN